MRQLVILFILFCLLFLPAFSGRVQAEMMASTSYRITSTVMSGGGTAMSSANFGLESTLGQSGITGSSTSVSYSLDSGFWHTLLLVILGDVNGDGSVDLEDVITTLQVVTGQSPSTIIREAETDGDGKIGIIEAIHLLKSLGEN